MKMRPLLMQLNIPFCPVHCRHCDRTICRPDPELRRRYARALRREIEASAGGMSDYAVSAIYIGGGIAGHMMDEELGELLRRMRDWYELSPETEITLKVHPGMVSVETLSACRRGGISRLEVEYLTGNLSEHEALGRFLNPDAMRVTGELLEGQKIGRSFELGLGLPGQTERSFLDSLKQAVSYGAEELGMRRFSLMAGEGNGEEERGQKNPRRRLPLREEGEAWLTRAEELLSVAGFVRYLPDRFALPGRESRFYAARDRGTEELGFGLGAESRFDGIYSRNTGDFSLYLQRSGQPEQIICCVRPLNA